MMTDMFLGKPFSWWARVKYVMDTFDIKDADELAYKLRSRGHKWKEEEGQEKRSTEDEK